MSAAAALLPGERGATGQIFPSLLPGRFPSVTCLMFKLRQFPTVPQGVEGYEHGINSKGHNGGGFLSASGRQPGGECV